MVFADLPYSIGPLGGRMGQGEPFTLRCPKNPEGGVVSFVSLGYNQQDGILTSIEINCTNIDSPQSFGVTNRSSTAFQTISSPEGFNFASVYSSSKTPGGMPGNPIVSLTVGVVDGDSVTGGDQVSVTEDPVISKNFGISPDTQIFGFTGYADQDYINGLQVTLFVLQTIHFHDFC